MGAPAAGPDPALARLVDQVRSARASRTLLEIRGGGTKAWYGGLPRGEPLDTRALAGISSHEPTELVATARAGTPLAELEAALDAHGQCLPFEPPRFGDGGGTVGGMVAAGLAGPARFAVGGVRDFVLGATLLTGKGELLTFGGQVMKNVAGYDVARLLAGSLGVLGVICEVSLKVLPKPASVATLEHAFDEAEALAWLDARRAQPLPITATAWRAGRFRVRLAGAAAAVASAKAALGGRAVPPDEADVAWAAVRDQRDPYFADAGSDGAPLWRLALPHGVPALGLAGDGFIEWSGAQRWLRTSVGADEVRAAAARVGGHATVFRGGDRLGAVFAPLTPPVLRVHRALKEAFDPAQILNVGRLDPEL